MMMMIWLQLPAHLRFIVENYDLILAWLLFSLFFLYFGFYHWLVFSVYSSVLAILTFVWPLWWLKLFPFSELVLSLACSVPLVVRLFSDCSSQRYLLWRFFVFYFLEVVLFGCMAVLYCLVWSWFRFCYFSMYCVCFDFVAVVVILCCLLYLHFPFSYINEVFCFLFKKKTRSFPFRSSWISVFSLEVFLCVWFFWFFILSHI